MVDKLLSYLEDSIEKLRQQSGEEEDTRDMGQGDLDHPSEVSSLDTLTWFFVLYQTQ